MLDAVGGVKARMEHTTIEDGKRRIIERIASEKRAANKHLRAEAVMAQHSRGASRDNED